MNQNILDIQVHHITYETTVHKVMEWVCAGQSRSVYAANVHMVMEAYDSQNFRSIVNTADLVTPDGMPLVWVMRLQGAKDQQRVYGPTLMLHLLEAAAKENIPVGFYGATEATLAKLSEKMLIRFPGLNIKSQIAPPFRPLTPEEDQQIIQSINESGVKILFVSLGCPKQEYWIAEHRGKINAVMVAVGAAFNFHAGLVKQAPAWMQKAGLEWLYRFIQEPQRLWKRYLWNNPRFVVLIIRDLVLKKFNRKSVNA